MSNAAHTTRLTIKVENDRECAHRLSCKRCGIHRRERSESFEPGWNIVKAAGMECSCAAVVTGVERRQQLPHFFAAALTNDETVWSHPQRFPHQASKADLPRPLKICLSGFKSNVMWVVGAQLCNVFDGDNAFARRDFCKECRKQCRLTGSCTAGDENVRPLHDKVKEPSLLGGIEGTERCQRIEICRSDPGYANGEGRSGGRYRRQHGMNSHARIETHIYARRLIIEVTPAKTDERNRQVTDFSL